MQVSAVRELPDGGFWTYEAKLDGYRCLAVKRGSGIVLWSRRGSSFTERFPAIARACEKLPQDTMIDAEVVVVDENGRCAFNALQHKNREAIPSYTPSIFLCTAVGMFCAYLLRNVASC